MKDFFYISVLLFAFCSSSNGQTNIALLEEELSTEYASLVEAIPFDLKRPNRTSSLSYFELNGGLIFIQAKINGVLGSYLLDTGASDLVLNSEEKGKSYHLAVGLKDSKLASEIIVESFELSDFEKYSFTAFSTDLSHLEIIARTKISGLIGSSLIEGQSLYINYQKKEFQFTASPLKRTMKKEGWASFSLARFGHLLATKIEIDGKKYWMGLDTGAEVSVLSDQFSKEIKHSRNSCLKICGLGSESISLPQILASSAKVGSLDFHTDKMLLSPFKNVQDQVGDQLDGLLGFPFFTQFEVMIDYKNGRLYLR